MPKLALPYVVMSCFTIQCYLTFAQTQEEPARFSSLNDRLITGTHSNSGSPLATTQGSLPSKG